MRIGLKIPYVIFFLFFLGSGDFQVQSLAVTGKDGPTEVLRGEDVTIPCLLSGVTIPLNLQILSVVWTLRLQNRTEHEVYGFRGSHQSSRPGSHMNDSDLQQGNASLYITNIQIEDEGDYHCFVIVTPDNGATTSTLHVSVEPQINLINRGLIENGYPGPASCKVSNFYPEEVKIRWVKHSKGIATNTSLDEDVSFTMPLRNSDGTFNVTSMLTVWPDSRDEPGDVFFCIVTHRSLKEEISLNFTVKRRSPGVAIPIALLVLYIVALLTILLKKCLRKKIPYVMYYHRWSIWIEIFHSAICILSVILICFLIYFTEDFDVTTWTYILLLCLHLIFFKFIWKYFKTGAFTVSEISGAKYIPHMKRTTLTCQITNFIQKEIQINVYLKRRNDKKLLIASWESTDQTSSKNYSNVLPLLEKGDESHTLLPVEIEVKTTKSLNRMYECLCSITITPNKDTDDGAVLGVEVEHPTLKWPIYVRRTLNVYSTVVGKPVVSAISGDLWIPHMKMTTLSCQITKFKLKKLQINVYIKRRNDMKKHLIHSWVSVDRPSSRDNTAAGHHRRDLIEEDSLLEDVVIDTTLPVEMEVEMTKTEDGIYKCDCRISLTPNADTDDGTVLTVEVDHTALEWPIYKYHILNVFTGDKPSLWRRWRMHVIKFIYNMYGANLIRIFRVLQIRWRNPGHLIACKSR